jgi:hypothetical protein
MVSHGLSHVNTKIWVQGNHFSTAHPAPAGTDLRCLYYHTYIQMQKSMVTRIGYSGVLTTHPRHLASGHRMTVVRLCVFLCGYNSQWGPYIRLVYMDWRHQRANIIHTHVQKGLDYVLKH